VDVFPLAGERFDGKAVVLEDARCAGIVSRVQRTGEL
jgi:hypothetical protein